MSEPFQRTLFPGTAHIGGRALPPLTFWRLACLQAIGSPFLQAADTQVTLADLLLAVRAVTTVNLVPPDLRPSWRDRLLYRRRKANRAWFEREATNFLQWLSLHQLRPELWQNDDDSSLRTITAPPLLNQITGLMHAGLSHTEAWDTAPGYASWLITAAAERDSAAIRFATADDTAFDAELADHDLRSESDIIAQARLDLDPATFDRWLAARSSL